MLKQDREYYEAVYYAKFEYAQEYPNGVCFGSPRSHYDFPIAKRTDPSNPMEVCVPKRIFDGIIHIGCECWEYWEENESAQKYLSWTEPDIARFLMSPSKRMSYFGYLVDNTNILGYLYLKRNKIHEKL